MIRSTRTIPSRLLSNGTTIRQHSRPKQHALVKKNQLSSNTKNNTTTNKEAASYSNPNLDPHQVSDSMIRSSATEVRVPGTEALNSITSEQKIKNYVLALTLVGFCTGVWYYSIQSVGKPEGGMEELLADAADAKRDQLSKSESERSAEELAQLDVTMSQLEGEAVDGDDIFVAVAAEDEIAQREEDLNMMSGKQGKAGRPLWKKVVFFWKK